MTKKTGHEATAKQDAPKENWFARHKRLSIVLGVLVLFMILGAAQGDKKDEASTATTQPTAAPTVSTAKEEKPEPAPEPKKPEVPAEYKSALGSAISYNRTAQMSKQGLYDQLTSQYGGKFTEAAAQYAIDNIKADWNANALASAKSYQKMNMSPAAIHDQLTSSYGAKFTAAEADYAIAHLND